MKRTEVNIFSSFSNLEVEEKTLFIGSCFAACLAGNIDTKIVTNIEQMAIIKIEKMFISEGILLKK